MTMYWSCPSCSHNETIPREDAVLRLQDIGRLKRGVRVATDLLLELARVSAADLTCTKCSATGVELKDGVPNRDDFGRRCDVCRKPIDPERLEVFPDSKLCTACQRGDDQGSDAAEPEYCSKCGTPLVAVKTTAGVTRYQMRCPHCRR